MILWRRFGAFTSLVYCWAAIGVAFMILINIAAASEDDEKIVARAKDFIAGGRTREGFLRGVKDGCVAGANTRRTGLSSQQIAAYCDCFANSYVKVITEEDYVYLAKNKKPSADLQEKSNQIRAACAAGQWPA